MNNELVTFTPTYYGKRPAQVILGQVLFLYVTQFPEFCASCAFENEDDCKLQITGNEMTVSYFNILCQQFLEGPRTPVKPSGCQPSWP
jgi:hypothetical protein